jgi:putative FmdB family regulatory protein
VPLYEYQCPKCGRFEIIHKFSDAVLTACPTCGREIQKLPSAPAIQFKGTGWYITDYARKSSDGDAAKGDGKGEGKAEGKGEAKAEAKTEGKGKTGEGASKGDSGTPATTSSKDSTASGGGSAKS